MTKKQREESIRHFGHKHELFYNRNTNSNDFRLPCNCCMSEISTNEEDYLFCKRNCMFHMHKSCAELPQKLKHPFHQQHSLTLLDEPPLSKGENNGYCCACGKSYTHFAYNCSECEFYIHSKCAVLFPTTRLPAKHQKLRHPHPLFVCETKIVKRNIVDFRCGGCYKSFDDGKEEIDYSTLIYVCLECHVLLHEACTDLPQQITQHPLHPDCTLTFHISSSFDASEYIFYGRKCDFCQNDYRLYFQCSDCSIKMDLRCALLTACPTTNYEPLGEAKDNRHPHPLIHCNINVNHYGLRNCDGCEQPLEKSTYYCISCKLFLHESCAHLPHQIQHPFHPHHPLTLSDSTDHFRGKEFSCNSCRYGGKRFAYLCHPCKFYLDLKCISPPSYPMMYMPELHQHPLAFSDIKPLKFICRLCDNSYKYKAFCPGFRCMQCYFGIHSHCFLLLPPTATALWHRHPLQLTRYPIRDGPVNYLGEDFYCDICENKRFLYNPSYYCAECHLVSHVHCVISEVMKYLQEKSTLVEELLGGTQLIVFDEARAIDSISDADRNKDWKDDRDINDEDFDKFLSGLDEEIETVNAELVEREKKCAELSAELELEKERCAEVSLKSQGLKEKRAQVIKERRSAQHIASTY